MSLNESIVEAAALEWFGELGYAVGHGPQLAPGGPAAERDSFGAVVPVGRLREAIRRLNPAIPQSRTLATLLPKLLSGELSVARAADTGLALREILGRLDGPASARQVRDDLAALRMLGLAQPNGHGRGLVGGGLADR